MKKLFFVLIALAVTGCGAMMSSPEIDVEDRLLSCPHELKKFKEKLDNRREIHELEVECADDTRKE